MILLSPWSRVTQEGKPSPKNYPWWPEVVAGLRGHEIWHLACAGEPGVEGCRKRLDDLPLRRISWLLTQPDCETWMSVDNFFQHLGWLVGKKGVAVFAQSDPLIFGHPENVNLLKGRGFLRQRQFGLWSQAEPRPEAFVPPDEVVKAVLLVIGKNHG